MDCILGKRSGLNGGENLSARNSTSRWSSTNLSCSRERSGRLELSTVRGLLELSSMAQGQNPSRKAWQMESTKGLLGCVCRYDLKTSTLIGITILKRCGLSRMVRMRSVTSYSVGDGEGSGSATYVDWKSDSDGLLSTSHTKDLAYFGAARSVGSSFFGRMRARATLRANMEECTDSQCVRASLLIPAVTDFKFPRAQGSQ
jgi:hypothetical protein